MHQIITLNSNKLLFLIDLDNQKYITLVKSINTGRKTILPMLILCGILIFKKQAEENDLDDNILLVISPI